MRGSATIILQARMGSSRLPGKAMRPVAGHTLLGQCLTRLKLAGVGSVVLATTTQPEDDVLEEEASRFEVETFRGPVDDVLTRFVQVAEFAHTEFVVRATGDNPAVDADSAGRLLDALHARRADYAVEEGLPYGSTVEVVRTTALIAAANSARDATDREHVTSYIRRPGRGFRCVVLPAPPEVHRSDLRFTIDTPSDLRYMREVLWYAELKDGPVPSLAHAIKAADFLARRKVA